MTTTTDEQTFCRHCGRPIESDDGIWYHPDTMSSRCDGPDDEPGIAWGDLVRQAEPAAKPLTITFDGEAWEWMYDIINRWTEKELAVVLNDDDRCRLLRIEGDVYDTSAVLIVTNDVLSNSGPIVERRVPLFINVGEHGGECAITKVHLL